MEDEIVTFSDLFIDFTLLLFKGIFSFKNDLVQENVWTNFGYILP